ncbi:DUF4221 family protein [Algoriphagus antarcticus]|uniref:Uncharacterized protein DUF4221 n=1 Tax=Algoriphagus antarcticus TaxID=238540 RepID=A0A3E0DVF3_9BACT|nr:DUF4221 family protein [Algoriphagus antarcticus]REG88411.1 uncharacterized protein DUF4221 [Algoriphagus antarcticus]
MNFSHLYRTIFVACSLLFNFSCSPSREAERVDFNVTVEDRFIETHDELGHFYYFNQVKNDSLIIFNVLNHSLEIVDLKENRLIKSINFELNGMNSVDQVRGFYFHNSDSIFLAEGDSRVSLMNIKGELINRYYNFSDSFDDGDREELYENNPSLDFSSQLLFSPITDEILVYFQSFDQPEKKRIFSAFSIETGKSRSLPIYYPEAYLGQRLDLSKLFLSSATQNENGFAFIFSGSPNVYKYNLETGEISFSEASPPFEKVEGDEIPFGSISREEKQLYMANNPFYYKIHYDSNSELYYRLSSPPRPNSIEEDFHYVNYNKILISILDKNFQHISDVYLPKQNTYNVGFSFVTSDGLWISYNSMHQDDERFIKGDLIRFNIDLE